MVTKILAIICLFVLSGCLMAKPDISPISKIEITAPIPTPTTTLPSSFLITTAFIPQAPDKNWNEPWQDACEEGAILTTYYYYQKINPTIDQIRTDLLSLFNYEASQHWGDSINTIQMSYLLNNYYNFHSKVISNPTISQIKQYLSHNIPIILPADGKILYKENKNFKDGGPWYHNLVLLGYDDRSQQFIVHDDGTQHGAYFHYSYQLIMKAVHDLPLSGKIEQIDLGEKNILLVLK